MDRRILTKALLSAVVTLAIFHLGHRVFTPSTAHAAQEGVLTYLDLVCGPRGDILGDTQICHSGGETRVFTDTFIGNGCFQVLSRFQAGTGVDILEVRFTDADTAPPTYHLFILQGWGDVGLRQRDTFCSPPEVTK